MSLRKARFLSAVCSPSVLTTALIPSGLIRNRVELFVAIVRTWLLIPCYYILGLLWVSSSLLRTVTVSVLKRRHPHSFEILGLAEKWHLTCNSKSPWSQAFWNISNPILLELSETADNRNKQLKLINWQGSMHFGTTWRILQNLSLNNLDWYYHRTTLILTFKVYLYYKII